MKISGKMPLKMFNVKPLIDDDLPIYSGLTELYANLNFTSVALVFFNERDEILALILSTARL